MECVQAASCPNIQTNVHPSMHPCIQSRPASVRKPPNCVRAHLGTVRVRSGRGEIAGNRSRSGQASADGLAGMTEKNKAALRRTVQKEAGDGKWGGSSSRVLVPRCRDELREFPSCSGKQTLARADRFFYLIPGHGGGQLSHPVPPLFLSRNHNVDV